MSSAHPRTLRGCWRSRQGKNIDDRLEVFYVGTDNVLYHTWQLGSFLVSASIARIAARDNGSQNTWSVSLPPWLDVPASIPDPGLCTT